MKVKLNSLNSFRASLLSTSLREFLAQANLKTESKPSLVAPSSSPDLIPSVTLSNSRTYFPLPCPYVFSSWRKRSEESLLNPFTRGDSYPGLIGRLRRSCDKYDKPNASSKHRVLQQHILLLDPCASNVLLHLPLQRSRV